MRAGKIFAAQLSGISLSAISQLAVRQDSSRTMEHVEMLHYLERRIDGKIQASPHPTATPVGELGSPCQQDLSMSGYHSRLSPQRPARSYIPCMASDKRTLHVSFGVFMRRLGRVSEPLQMIKRPAVGQNLMLPGNGKGDRSQLN